MALGQQRDVERPATRGRVVVADLVAKGCLARPGQPLEDVNAPLGKPPRRMTSRPGTPLGTRSIARSVIRCVARLLVWPTRAARP